MSLDELYQDLILDHFKKPRCRGCLDKPQASSVVYNPLCGDRVELALKVKDENVEDIAFEGKGCAISQASASMMSELCKGKRLVEVKALYDAFKMMMLDEGTQPPSALLGDAVTLEGVKKFPARIKCALLAWEALGQCLNQIISR